MWIWQHPNYPNFSFDKSAIDTLANKLKQRSRNFKRDNKQDQQKRSFKGAISALEDEINKLISHRGREAKKIRHLLIGKKETR